MIANICCLQLAHDSQMASISNEDYEHLRTFKALNLSQKD